MSAMDSIQSALKAIPPVTRAILIPSAIIPILFRLKIVSPYLFVYDVTAISQDWHIWRLLTPLFLTMPSFAYLTNLFFRYSYSNYLETGGSGQFAGRTADYITFILFCIVNYWFVGWAFGLVTFWDMFTLSIIYLWSKYNPETLVSFYFGIKFKGVYLPFVLAGLDLVLGGSVLESVLGIGVAHAWYFCQEIYPKNNSSSSSQPLIPTPQFILNYFPYTRSNVSTIGGAVLRNNQPQQSSSTGSRFSGTGRKLGD